MARLGLNVHLGVARRGLVRQRRMPEVMEGEEVVALLEKLVAVTEGTFQLEPGAFLNSVEYSAVLDEVLELHNTIKR